MADVVRQPKEVTREQIAEWEKRRPEVKALNDATMDKPRGFLLPREQAWSLCGGESIFKKVAKYWKQSLLWVRGITVEWDHANKGYLLIDTDRHLTKRQSRVQRSAEKKFREEALRLGLMRDEDFDSDHQRKLRLLFMDQNNDSAGKIAAQRERLRAFRIIGGDGEDADADLRR